MNPCSRCLFYQLLLEKWQKNNLRKSMISLERLKVRCGHILVSMPLKARDQCSSIGTIQYANIAKLPLNLLATPQTSRITWTKNMAPLLIINILLDNLLLLNVLELMFKLRQGLGFYSTNAMEITTAIGKHVILDIKPLSSVESKPFGNILAKAQLRFVLPSRTYYKDTFTRHKTRNYKRDKSCNGKCLHTN